MVVSRRLEMSASDVVFYLIIIKLRTTFFSVPSCFALFCFFLLVNVHLWTYIGKEWRGGMSGLSTKQVLESNMQYLQTKLLGYWKNFNILPNIES